MPGYTYFGSMLVMAYVCIAAVLFVNLLIAVLSNVYERLSKVVDALFDFTFNHTDNVRKYFDTILDEAENGYNIVTTIDTYIQYELENQLKATYEENKPNERGILQ